MTAYKSSDMFSMMNIFSEVSDCVGQVSNMFGNVSTTTDCDSLYNGIISGAKKAAGECGIFTIGTFFKDVNAAIADAEDYIPNCINTSSNATCKKYLDAINADLANVVAHESLFDISGLEGYFKDIGVQFNSFIADANCANTTTNGCDAKFKACQTAAAGIQDCVKGFPSLCSDVDTRFQTMGDAAKDLIDNCINANTFNKAVTVQRPADLPIGKCANDMVQTIMTGHKIGAKNSLIAIAGLGKTLFDEYASCKSN